MEKEKFIEYLKTYSDDYVFEEKKDNGEAGLVVRNKIYNTLTFFSDLAISREELGTLIKETHQGKNIDQITRVTGYFSKVGGWNKGKVAELKDRARVRVDEPL